MLLRLARSSITAAGSFDGLGRVIRLPVPHGYRIPRAEGQLRVKRWPLSAAWRCIKARRCSALCELWERDPSAHPRYLSRHDACRSRPLASCGLRNRRSNTRVCSAPALDQASLATGLDRRASLKVLTIPISDAGRTVRQVCAKVWRRCVTLATAAALERLNRAERSGRFSWSSSLRRSRRRPQTTCQACATARPRR